MLDKIFPEHRQFDIKLNHWERTYRLIPGSLEDRNPRYEKRSNSVEFPTQHIANCRDLIEWSNRRYEPSHHSDFHPIFAYYAAYCYSLDALKSAKPARISHIRNFRFDDKSPNFLPAMIGDAWWCNRLDIFLEANREGVPWRKFPYLANGLGNRTYRLSIENENKFHMYDTYISDTNTRQIGRRASITIMGRGDFDDDGYEDLLIQGRYENSPISPRIIYSTLYLLSRRQDNAVLRATDLIGPPPGGQTTCDARKLIRESGRFE